jgi:hypothetical protein
MSFRMVSGRVSAWTGGDCKLARMTYLHLNVMGLGKLGGSYTGVLVTGMLQPWKSGGTVGFQTTLLMRSACG